MTTEDIAALAASEQVPQDIAALKRPRGRPRKVVAAPPTPQPQAAATTPAAPAEPPDLPVERPKALSEVDTPPVTGPTGAGSRDVIVLLPQYKQTNPLTMVSVMALRDPQHNAMICTYGDAFIAHTRNRLADAFMRETSAQWALFVDDDMVVPMGNATWFKKATGFGFVPDRLAGFNTIERLLAAKQTLVGGLYFGRQPSAERKAMFAEGHREGPYSGPTNGGQPPFAALPQDRVVPTKWVGTGCMLVNRRVFRDIQLRFPHLAPKTPKDVWQYFSGAQDELVQTVDKYLSGTATREDLAAAQRRSTAWNLNTGEDVLFCQRAAEAGHQPHVDLGLLCGHVGHAIYGPR